MEKALEAMHKSQNGLLESPTGTGKTVCLLCATLAFQKRVMAKRKRAPLIVYASRTHGQLAQVVKELKKTGYRPRMSVLGARQHGCVHPRVSKLSPASALDAACRKLVSGRGCPHHRRVESFVREDAAFDAGEPRDIEDLVTLGKGDGTGPGPCPFFLAREQAKRADLVLMPYSYLIDKSMRLGELDYGNAVVVFDEAHNLEGACSEASSVDIDTRAILECAREVEKCFSSVKTFEEMGGVGADDDPRARRSAAELKKLMEALEALHQVVFDMELSQSSSSSEHKSMTRPGSHAFDVLERINLTGSTEEGFFAMLDDASAVLASVSQEEGKKKHALPALTSQLKAIFDARSEGIVDAYKLHVSECLDANGSPYRNFGFWCFVPGVHLSKCGLFSSSSSCSSHFSKKGSSASPLHVQSRFVSRSGIRSVLLASGTLSPMQSFASELGIRFPVGLENAHVVGPKQVWAGVLTNGPGGGCLDSSYTHRGTDQYKLELGRTLFNLAKCVPEGVLVFFPSYSLLEQCTQRWRELPMSQSSRESVWSLVTKHKPIVVEPRDANQFGVSQEEYRSKLLSDRKKGAIFLAVCRGKASEGLDFADEAGRLAIVTGSPAHCVALRIAMIDPSAKRWQQSQGYPLLRRWIRR